MLFGFTTVVGAALLFLLQPMLARYILPWFGGQAAVWTTVLLFFQGALLAGYAYAHLLNRSIPARLQAIVHTGLLLLTLGFLPITPSDRWKPLGTEEPTLRIVVLLTSSVGLPLLLLSATSPLLQAWHARLHGGGVRYRLYAWSNAASLLALWSYPLLVEPLLGRGAQTLAWSWAFVGFTLLSSWCAWRLWRAPVTPTWGNIHYPDEATAEGEAARNAAAPTRASRLLWVLLSLTGTLLLSAVTNATAIDVAPVPFLWVLVLSLYLLTFILTFRGNGTPHRWLGGSYVIPAFLLLYWVTQHGADYSIVTQIAAYAVGFFGLCLALHEELGRLRPSSAYLTGYYLALSAGGVFGGAFVAILAPRLFVNVAELPIGLLIAAGLLLWARMRDMTSPLAGGRPLWAWGALLLVFTGYAVAIWRGAIRPPADVLTMQRSFYGVLSVRHVDAGQPTAYLALRHGRIDHGIQYLAPTLRSRRTTYYTEASGLGLAMAHFPVKPGQRRIGMIGFGIGTTLSYCRRGDQFRVYEIDPHVVELATRHFTFRRQAPCEVALIPGDARLSLEREPDQRFDLLIVDAFSSDAIPVHLLTLEAFSTYWRHLQPDGVLLVHVSSLYYDLPPVVHAAGRRLHIPTLEITNADDGFATWGADWIVMTNNAALLNEPVLLRAKRRALPTRGPDMAPWTDDHASILKVFTGWPTGW